MWSDAAYRSLNEARRFAGNGKPTAAINAMVGEFLDRSYVATQVLDICKLTDGGDDVVSLRRLLDDMSTSRDLITRENFVSYDGLPYDYERVQQAEIVTMTPEQTGGMRWLATTGPEAWVMSERLHVAFVAPDSRSPQDLIHENVFFGHPELVQRRCAEENEDVPQQISDSRSRHEVAPKRTTQRLGIFA